MFVYPAKCYYYDILSYEDELEKWECKYEKKDQFTATVLSSTYYEVGDKIVFHKIADNIDESDIPYPDKETEQQNDINIFDNNEVGSV